MCIAALQHPVVLIAPLSLTPHAECSKTTLILGLAVGWFTVFCLHRGSAVVERGVHLSSFYRWLDAFHVLQVSELKCSAV